MTKIVVSLMAVALMATSAQAVFSDNFDSYTPDPCGFLPMMPDQGSQWEKLWNYEQYGPVALETGIDGNPTQCIDFVDGAFWGNLKHELAPENQYSAGYVQFDWNPGPNGSPNIRQIFSSTSGYNPIEFNFSSDGVWEREGTSGVAHNPSNSIYGLFPAATWTTLRINFDFDADGPVEGGNGGPGTGYWSLDVNGVPTGYEGNMFHIDGVPHGGWPAAGQKLTRIAWDCASGNRGQYMDNIVVAPEPATCLLLVSGLALLRRRRA